MRVLVTFAVEAEFAPWRKRHNFELEQLADLRTYRMESGGASIVVLLTGMGSSCAGAATLGIQMIATEVGQFFDVCISTGLGGALQSEIKAGEIVVASELHKGAARPEMGADLIPCDHELIAAAKKCGASEVRSFYQADHIVITAEEKAKLSISADVVEMESFAVLSECMAWGTRGVAVRAISDTADDDLPIDLNLALTGTGGVSVTKILGQVLRQPKSIPGLVRFGRQSRRAAESLGNFLDGFIDELAGRSEEFPMRKREVSQAR